MQVYRYETRISKKGLIQISLSKQLFDKEVEIIILPKKRQNKSKTTPSDFVDKWSGFLSNVDVDASKYEYLSDKYR